MRDLRSASRVLRPRQFQEIKGGHQVFARAPRKEQKTKVWATDRPSDFFVAFEARECPRHRLPCHGVFFSREVRPLFWGLHPDSLMRVFLFFYDLGEGIQTYVSTATFFGVIVAAIADVAVLAST
ncbi:hypothetical protein TNCV_99781 [Trichonephila clavipes]|nr:hypothetical protein TNCV_99781 [Trichonephila clavipes]